MKKILYIEDEPDQATIVRSRIEAEGYEFARACDGEEGLKKVKEINPDLILLDLFLPKIDGFEVCKRLKDNPETSSIPVIVVTASGVKYVDEQVRSVGADDCLKKPYEAKELIEKVKTLLGEISTE